MTDPETADPTESWASALTDAWSGVTSTDGLTVVAVEPEIGLAPFCAGLREHALASGALVIPAVADGRNPLAVVADGLGCGGADAAERVWAISMALLDNAVDGRLAVLLVTCAGRLSEAWLSALEHLLRIESGSARMLQVVLIGPPALQKSIADSGRPRLAARKLHCVSLAAGPPTRVEEPDSAPTAPPIAPRSDECPAADRLADLWRAVRSRDGLVVLTGRSAAGRSELVTRFVEEAAALGTKLIVAPRPDADPVELVARALARGRWDTESAEAAAAAQDELRSSNVVFLVEDAEAADQLWLRSLGRLLDLADRRGKLVQVVLVGPPALLHVLAGPEAAPSSHWSMHAIHLDDGADPPGRAAPASDGAAEPVLAATSEPAAEPPAPIPLYIAHVATDAPRLPSAAPLRTASQSDAVLGRLPRPLWWGATAAGIGALVAAHLIAADPGSSFARASFPRADIPPITAGSPAPPLVHAPSPLVLTSVQALPIAPVPLPRLVPAPSPPPLATAPAAPEQLALTDRPALLPAAAVGPEGAAGSPLSDRTTEPDAYAASTEQRRGAPGLVLIAQAGDTIPQLYRRIYTGVVPPPYSAVIAANPRPLRPGALLVFPAPPDGWANR